MTVQTSNENVQQSLRESSVLFVFQQLLCHDADFKEMGVPLGPRKKLMGYIRDYAKHEVSATDQSVCLSVSLSVCLSVCMY